MKKNKKRGLIALLCAAFAALGATAVIGATTRDVDANEGAYAPSTGLVLTEYNVPNYNANVKIYDPNGKEITPDAKGNIRLLVVGEYKIVYSDGVKKVRALLNAPKSTLSLATDFEESYPAGQPITLPKLVATNEAMEFLSYHIEVTQPGSSEVKTINASFDEEIPYTLSKVGTYTFHYYVINLAGEREELKKTVTTVNEKSLFCDALPASVYVGTEVFVGYPYGYYNGKSSEVKVTVTDPKGQSRVITSATFRPEIKGEYSVLYETTLGGSVETKTQTFVASIPTADFLFVRGNGTNGGLVELPDYAPSEGEGILLTSPNASSAFYYRDVVDLSSLTKEDTLIEFVAQEENGAFMKEVCLTLTDIYDASKSVKVRFKMSQYSENASYVTVVYDDGEYGLSNESKDLGQIRPGYGTTAYYTSFRPDTYDSRYAFNLQYDYAENALYMITRDNAAPSKSKQLKVLGLNEAAPNFPAENLFEGFTTGEVYVKVEFANNAGAGIYLTELAGRKAATFDTTDFANALIVYDEYAATTPQGTVGYTYRIPTARLSPLYTGEGGLSVSVQDSDGNAVSVTDGAFTPTKAGEYTIVYATTFAGEKVEKKLPVTVNATPNEILLGVGALQVGYLDYLAAPTVTATGGSGALSVQTKLLCGGEEIPVGRNGKYYVNKTEGVEFVVTATDYIGYTKTECIPVTVTENHRFIYGSEIAKAGKAGTIYRAPTFTVAEYKGGRVTEYTDGEVYAVFGGSDRREITSAGLTLPEGYDEFALEFVAGGYTERYVIPVYAKTVATGTEYFVTQGVSEKLMTEAGAVLRASQDATIALPYKLSADESYLSFAVHKDFSTFDSMTFTFTDSAQPDLALRFVFSEYDGEKDSIALCVNGGKKLVVAGSKRTYSADASANKDYIGKAYTLFNLVVDIRSGLLKDSDTGVAVARLTNYDNGAAFDGFEGNACYMQVTVEKRESSIFDFVLSQISNNYFNYYNDASGYEDCDSIGPAIVVLGNKDWSSGKLGEKFTVPAAIAYDVLSGYADVTVSVTHGGKTILKNADCSTSQVITLEGYGSYSLTYKAVDYYGNTSTKTVTVVVADKVAPTITVEGEYKKTVSVGGSVNILDFEAVDGQGEIKTAQVFVKDGSLKIHYVKVGDKYVFEKAGTYEIVYRVVDASNNITRKVFTIVVED